jgi:hypothetical protein
MSSPDELNPLVANHSATNPSKLMELLRKKVDEELAAPSQTGMSVTPNLDVCLRIVGIRAYLVRCESLRLTEETLFGLLPWHQNGYQ